jgi:hypothetical protein
VAGEIPGGDGRVEDDDPDRIPQKGVDLPRDSDQGGRREGSDQDHGQGRHGSGGAGVGDRPPGRTLQRRDQAADEADRVGKPPGVPQREVEKNGDQDLVFQSHQGRLRKNS